MYFLNTSQKLTLVCYAQLTDYAPIRTCSCEISSNVNRWSWSITIAMIDVFVDPIDMCGHPKYESSSTNSWLLLNFVNHLEIVEQFKCQFP